MEVDTQEEPDEYGAELKAKIEEIRDEMLAKYQEEKEARLEEAGGQEEEEEEDMDAVRAAFYVRIPNEFIYKLLRDRLNENDCRNRGYIVDGFPRSFTDAQYVFLQRMKKWDEEASEWVEVEDEEE